MREFDNLFSTKTLYLAERIITHLELVQNSYHFAVEWTCLYTFHNKHTYLSSNFLRINVRTINGYITVSLEIFYWKEIRVLLTKFQLSVFFREKFHCNSMKQLLAFSLRIFARKLPFSLCASVDVKNHHCLAIAAHFPFNSIAPSCPIMHHNFPLLCRWKLQVKPTRPKSVIHCKKHSAITS